jgi:hypothetical protein
MDCCNQTSRTSPLNCPLFALILVILTSTSHAALFTKLGDPKPHEYNVISEDNSYYISARTTGSACKNIDIFQWNFTQWSQNHNINICALSLQSGWYDNYVLSSNGRVLVAALPNQKLGTMQEAGEIRVWMKNNNNWEQVNGIEGENGWEQIGYSPFRNTVSLADDGLSMLVSYRDSVKSIQSSKIYDWTDGNWIRRGESIRNGAMLSGNGLVVLVLPIKPDQDSCDSYGDDYYTGLSAFCLYEWTNSAWTPLGGPVGTARNSRASISFNGKKLIVGEYDKGGSRGTLGPTNYGQIHTYSWNDVSWEKLGEDLIGTPNAQVGEALGYGIDISANGDLMAASSVGYNPDSPDIPVGKVQFFKWTGDKWEKFVEDILGDAEMMSPPQLNLSADNSAIRITWADEDPNDYNPNSNFETYNLCFNETDDLDCDNVLNFNDAFPLDPNETLDTDSDGIGNNADEDDDNDGVTDFNDAFPLDPNETLDTDSDGLGNNSDEDDDNDGVIDANDAFPLDVSETVDTDADGIGNNSDEDDDNDGVIDANDAFPLDPNETVDTDSDGLGNNSDEDDDNDGVIDANDAFPLDLSETVDTDSDGVGDNADALPFDAGETFDQDYDGVGDNSDNCINVVNTFQEDLDGDGLGDACDSVFNPDPDGDGYTYNDLFPFDASEALDSDGDGIGDNSDENYLYPENGKNGSSVNFQAYNFVPNNLGARAIYTSTGKLNADSKDDLLIVCGNGCGQIISFTSNANETWNLNLVSETLDVPTSAFIADIDGDSDSDILVTNYRDNGGVYYFESVAGAIDSDPVIINSDFYGAKSVKAYDFDKDGDQDLVYASSWRNEVVFEKNLSSSTTKITLSTEVWGVTDLILVDFNRDSWMDIMAVAENSGELIYFENNKNGQFRSKETIFEEEGDLRDAMIADYDADGDLDIFAATSGSFGRAGLMLYKRVAGSLERQIIDNTSMFFNYPIEAFPKKIISSDFDNDGDLDLFVEFSNSNAAFYEKSSSGVFSDPKLVFGSTYNQSVIGSYELSDYDNDGDDDLWWVSSPFGIMIFENTCSDIDGDGICDVRDNDQDGDSLSNEEELLLGLDPRNNDSDRDGVDDALDDFPLNLLETTDTDGDGVGDNADLFPNNINEFQDFDLDGIGDNTDDDDDNDGIADVDDAFPFNPGEWSDTDLDGIGDRRDLDDDGDGVNDIDDLFPLDLTEAYDSDGDGFGDNGDAFPDDPNESLDTDADGIGNNSDLDDDNDGFSDEQELIDGTDPLSKFSCREGCASLDLDGSEKYDALTDGLLLLRGMFGLDGSALVAGAIGSDATYTSAVDITARINALGSAADIDGNGQIDALTDGLLTLRYLFGLDDDTLINGVVADDATRKTAEEIEAHLETLMPAL